MDHPIIAARKAAIDFPNAHEQLANIVREIVETDSGFIAAMLKAGQPPQPDAMDLHARTKAALTAYLTAWGKAREVKPRTLVNAALEALKAGDLEATKLALDVIGALSDFHTAPEEVKADGEGT